MRRTLIALVAFLALGSAFAQSVVVHGSIYMVMSPATSAYFQNIRAVKDAIRATDFDEAESFELNRLSFLSASVEGTVVTYFYSLVKSVGTRTCGLQVVVRKDTTQAALLAVSADHACREWDD